MLDEHGHLLTERFFFGEEDFEFSMRMQKDNILTACVLDSLIYHKVGASGNKMHRLGKLYLHYLNRFIDVRLDFGTVKYFIWILLNIPVVFRYFYRSTRNMPLVFRLLKFLLRDAKRKECVSQDDFNSLVLKNNYFPFEV